MTLPPDFKRYSVNDLAVRYKNCEGWDEYTDEINALLESRFDEWAGRQSKVFRRALKPGRGSSWSDYPTIGCSVFFIVEKLEGRDG